MHADARVALDANADVPVPAIDVSVLETDGDVEAMTRGTYLPPSVVGGPRYLRDRCADALCTVRQLGRNHGLLFITFTFDKKDWPEVTSRLAQFDASEKLQDIFDRASLDSEVFKSKVDAFLARLRSGTIFRNLGRPKVTTEEYSDDNNDVRSRRLYTYPMQTAGGGYLIVATEDQDRGLPHIHVAYSPAQTPATSAPWKSKPRPGERLDHIDEIVCARIPDERMLRTFKLIGPASEMRALLAVTDDSGAVHAKYAYLDGKAEDEEVLHPDIVADFGYTTVLQLLNRLVQLVCGAPRCGPDDSDHWSLHPYRYPVGGKLVHKHHAGPDVPDKHCKRKGHMHDCKDRYPKQVAAFTHMTEDGFINYERAPTDIMIVPYNPWILLYFTSHINVEYVCSAVNVILYLFKLLKYILKGDDQNRLQLVADGTQQQGQQGSADRSTHRRDERRDEIKEWRNAKTTCAPQAYRRLAEHMCYIQEPPTETAYVHSPRARNADDTSDVALSEWEKYLARPCEALPADLADLNAAKFEDLLRGWRFGNEAEAPAEDTKRSVTREEVACGVRWWSKDGRPVYYMDQACAQQLRANTVRDITPMYYWRRLPGAEHDRTVRLKRVPRNCGVTFYVRLLAKHVVARSFDDLRRYNGTLHESYEVACHARGLLAEASEAREVIQQAVDAGDAAPALRSLFVQFFHGGFPIAELLDSSEMLDTLASDQSGTLSERRSAALADIDDGLTMLGQSLADFAPQHSVHVNVRHEVEREQRLYANRAAQRALADSESLALDTLPGEAEQSEVVRWGLRGKRRDGEQCVGPADLAALQLRAPDGLEIGVEEGDGGAGKTRTAKRLVAEMRARGEIVLVAASTNLAATNYERGVSVHALCLLAGDGEDEDGNVTIKLSPAGRMTIARLMLLRAARLIVLDEYSSLHASIADALIQFLCQQQCNVRLLFVGDRQQIPPVVTKGSREEIIESSLLSLPSFRVAHHMLLTKPYRQHCATWASFVRSVGDDSAPALDSHKLTSTADGRRAIVLNLVDSVFYESGVNSEQRALEWLFGTDMHGHLDVHSGFKAILCTRNDDKDVWNARVNDVRARQTGDHGQTYIASHKSEVSDGGDDGDSMAAEALGDDEMAMFQNADHSVPRAEFTIRVGDVMLLAKTLDKAAGLVKNQRVVVTELRWNAVVVRIDRTDAPPLFQPIGRACFSFALKRGSPLKVLRTQLPLVHAWALTINRSQGQTLDKILIDLRHAPFTHGQAYVAISRVHISADCGVFVNASCCIQQRAVLGSVVYHELLRPLTFAAPHAMSNAPCRRRRADFVAQLDDAAPAAAQKSQRRR